MTSCKPIWFQRSHLQTPLHWELVLQHRNLGEARVVIQSLKNRIVLYTPQIFWWRFWWVNPCPDSKNILGAWDKLYPCCRLWTWRMDIVNQEMCWSVKARHNAQGTARRKWGSWSCYYKRIKSADNFNG